MFEIVNVTLRSFKVNLMWPAKCDRGRWNKADEEVDCFISTPAAAEGTAEFVALCEYEEIV